MGQGSESDTPNPHRRALRAQPAYPQLRRVDGESFPQAQGSLRIRTVRSEVLASSRSEGGNPTRCETQPELRHPRTTIAGDTDASRELHRLPFPISPSELTFGTPGPKGRASPHHRQYDGRRLRPNKAPSNEGLHCSATAASNNLPCRDMLSGGTGRVIGRTIQSNLPAATVTRWGTRLLPHPPGNTASRARGPRYHAQGAQAIPTSPSKGDLHRQPTPLCCGTKP